MTPLGHFLDPALIHRLNQLQLTARSVVEGAAGGDRRSSRQGASVEFAQHRAFAAGDERRRIDWRLLARTGRLFVREDHEETNARVLLAIDVSGSMQYRRRFESKIHYAHRVIAAMAYLLLARREAVGLATFDQSVDAWLPPSNASNQLASILDTLNRSARRSTRGPAKGITQVASRLRRRSLVVIASDLLLPPALLNDALARLRHAHHEVVVLRILDADERTFPFSAAVLFRGLEGEPALIRNASIARKVYLDRFNRHEAEVQRVCLAHQAELHALSTDVPLEEAVVNFLTRRMHSGS